MKPKKYNFVKCPIVSCHYCRHACYKEETAYFAIYLQIIMVTTPIWKSKVYGHRKRQKTHCYKMNSNFK